MPTEKSRNKVRVTKLFGGSEPLGEIDPVVHMRVKYGQQQFWIKSLDSGNFTVDLAMTSGGAVKHSAHPHDLFVDVTVASGYGWPNGTGAVKEAHGVTFSAGVPRGVGSGITYLGGNGIPVTFGR